MRFGIQLLASLTCLPFATACLEEEGAEIGEDEEGEENLSTTESTLCSDGAANATVAFDEFGGESTVTSLLPTNSYDHPDCSDRFAVEVTGVSSATEEFSIAAGWGEALPNTQSQCELALANVQTHEYKLIGFNCSGSICAPKYGWQQVGPDIQLHGEWQPFFDGHVCRMVPNQPLPVLQPNSFRSKVRVSVRAYAWALFFPAYKRGEAGVWSAPIIY